jgi:uncharacterized coiled-coil protein SlyX
MEVNWTIAGPLLLNLIWCALYWAMVVQNRKLEKRIEELESTRPVCSLCAMKVDEAAGVDVAALNRRIAELESTIKQHGTPKETLLDAHAKQVEKEES